MRNNPFKEKRVKTFEQLGTEANQWVHAKVISFKPTIRKSKKGVMKIIWIPEYEIPEGYKNPLTRDQDFSDSMRCQLCDTKIIEQGVILHHDKKYCLFVGTDCYDIYETEDHKNIRLNLLSQIMDDYFNTQLAEVKKNFSTMIAAYRQKGYDLEYKFYTTIARNRWVDWGRLKTYNFLAKYGWCCEKLGYTPELGVVFSFSQYKKYLRSVLCQETHNTYMKRYNELKDKYYDQYEQTKRIDYATYAQGIKDAQEEKAKGWKAVMQYDLKELESRYNAIRNKK